MAKPPKDAALFTQIDTRLNHEQIATACEAALAAVPTGVSRGTVRLEEASPGLLVYSCRGPGGYVEQMVFEVRVAEHEGRRRLRTKIRSYKTLQTTYLGIPTSAKKIAGLKKYRQFAEFCAAEIEQADKTVHIELNMLSSND